MVGGVVLGVDDDLVVVVDGGGVEECVAGVGWDEVVEVLEGSVAVDEGALADESAGVVERFGGVAVGEGADVGHRVVVV